MQRPPHEIFIRILFDAELPPVRFLPKIIGVFEEAPEVLEDAVERDEVARSGHHLGCGRSHRLALRIFPGEAHMR